MSKLNVVVFLGSVREGRMGERVGLLIKKVLEEGNHQVEMFGKIGLIILIN
jgi:NAD(P)H-dependent FMN reductase